MSRMSSGALPSLVLVILAAVVLYRPDAESHGDAPRVEAKSAPARRPIRTVSSRADWSEHRPSEASRTERGDPDFTRVAPGETLAAVASRVYGAADQKERLWRANRDQLASPDASLVAGTILRTP